MSENEDYYAGFSLGRIAERERIIKLIEDSDYNWGNIGGDWIEMPKYRLVELIKGETNDK